MDTTKLHQSIALTLLDGIGPKNAKTLVAYLGGVDAIFETRSFKKLAIPGFSPERLKALNRKEALSKAEKEIMFIEKNKVTTFFYLDKNYPHRLKNCIDAPLMLYSFGTAELNPAKTISIVGTRNVTSYGHGIIEELITSLIPYNTQVVSGLAYGVDILTHRACLKHGISTVAVLGHGLDRIYPHHHRPTAKKMLFSNGGLLTEFPSGTNPDRENFPRRNRIVAGMTDATIVIESSIKGGSLITANLANDYNRDVFAYPGNVFNEYSKGCNALIANNKAHLVTSGNDVIKLLGWEKSAEIETVQKQLFNNLSSDERLVMQELGDFPEISIDVLAIKLKKPTSWLSSTLLTLELQGLVMCLPGKKYRIA